MITGNRALLMLIAARFSGSGSGKDLLSRATSLIAFGLPFSRRYRDGTALLAKSRVLEEGWPTWRRPGMSVSAPFVWRCPIGSTMAPFPRSAAS